MARVILAMSGGVDSSVAAHLLLRAGHEVIGVFMRHGEMEDESCRLDDPLPIARGQQGCCTAEDARDARRIAQNLGIPFYALDLQDDFHRIVDYFVDEYGRGRTPNPCVVCNHWIKFGRLFDYADSVDAEFVATGHYAQLEAGHPPRLVRGLDGGKDQSYVLFGIQADRLPRMLLPVGGYTKPQIRELAEQWGLAVAAKPDSQEICFVSPGQHAALVSRRLAARGETIEHRSGEIVTVAGEVVGQHAGVEHFTIGQRKGLGVAMGEPHYVVDIDAKDRRVTIGPKSSLVRRRLTATHSNWLIDPPSEPFECGVQIRYRSPAVPATVRLVGSDMWEAEFHQPCAGIAPGQAAVCYDGDRLIGGGWIATSS